MSFLCYSFYGFFLLTLCLFRGRWRCRWSRDPLWQIFLYFTKYILNNACLKWLDYMKMKSFGIAYSCMQKQVILTLKVSCVQLHLFRVIWVATMQLEFKSDLLAFAWWYFIFTSHRYSQTKSNWTSYYTNESKNVIQ